MKGVLLGGLILFFSLPSYAQGHATMGGAAASAGYTQGGGSGVGGGGTSPSLLHTPLTRFEYTYAHGTDCEFVPSSFMAYDDAVKLGRSILDTQPRSLGEIAAEYRAKKKQR